MLYMHEKTMDWLVDKNPPTLNDQLSSALVKLDLLDPQRIERADALAKSAAIGLDRAVLQLGLVEEHQLLEVLAGCMGLDFIAESKGLSLYDNVVSELGQSYLQTNTVAPLFQDDSDADTPVMLLVQDPANQTLLTEIQFQLERPIHPIVASSRTIRALLGQIGHSISPQQRSVSNEQALKDRDAFDESQIDGPVIKWVSRALNDAVGQGASDVHFASADHGLVVRYRINGLLARQDMGQDINPSAAFARLKVMSGMNVAERRKPQDGRMTSIVGGRAIDFRVSALPTQMGESIVCRVLDPNALRLGWEHLGFDAETEAAVRRIVEMPSGLFLVTGPTGSGKTTTLYTALNHLRSETRKIISIEDPVEYQLPDVEQVQVHEEVGLTFANALRSILRQDPNVIMVGEIRDRETAEIVCRAALVGRMVLSTLHTRSAAGAVARLVDLGVDEFIVRDVLRGVLGQELEIVQCGRCQGQGCGKCGGVGTLKRRLITEVVEGF